MRHRVGVVEELAPQLTDDASYQALADALSDQGDPRGELISLQLRSDPTLRSSIERALAPFAAEVQAIVPGLYEWQRGFVCRATLRHLRDAARMRELLDHPSLQLVHELDLECDRFFKREIDPIIPIVEAIGGRMRRSVRTLKLSEQLGDHEPELRLDAMWSKLPNLAQARLRSERVLFDGASHGKLTKLELGVLPLGEGTWDVPNLRVLRWDPAIESECGVEVFDRLWTQELPALRELELIGHLLAFEPLFDRHDVRDFIAKLDRLVIDARGVVESLEDLEQHLVAQARALEHLKELVICGFDLEAPRARKRLPNLRFESRPIRG